MNIYEVLDERSDDRPESVETFVEEHKDRVGYGVSEPLGAASYDDYPKGRSDLLLPSAGPILRQIANSSEVSSLEDMSEELNVSVNTLNDTIGIHGVVIDDTDSEDTSSSSVVEAPDGSGGTQPVNTAKLSEDFRVGYHFYNTLGMTVSEISMVCDMEESEVRRILQTFSIL